MSEPARSLSGGDGGSALTAPTPQPKSHDDLRLLLVEAAARRSVDLEGLLAEAGPWVRAWWDDAIGALDEPPPVRSLVVGNAAHYAVWHAAGPSTGVQPGFLALHGMAIREARDVDRGTEAASETWLDVRSRLEKTVARAAAGKSIPDFSGPDGVGEDNCHRYHRIQVRLRVRGKWTKRRATEIYEEGRHAAEWKAGFRAAEARTYALPLHFAAWWTVLDVKERRTRDGRVKGVAWWWSMVLHALDVEKIDALGGDRNDPTEALLRIRLRFAVAQGLAGWLRRWSVGHPYWSQVEFGLPDPENAAARAAAEQALAEVRGVLQAAIEAVDMSEDERKALTGTLMRGENVRTSTRLVDGEDAAARQDRLFALGERVGRDAADRLDGGGRGGGGGGGGGGSRPHAHADVLIAKLASGSAPSPDEVRTLSLAVAECEECRDRWVGRVDEGPYLSAATAPGPRSGRRWLGAGAVALAAAVALFAVLGGGDPADVGLRGAEGAVPAHLDLMVQRGSGAEVERYDPARAVVPGDRLYFMVATDRQAQLRLWVDGPEGAEVLGTADVGPQRATFGSGSEAVWYRVEREGSYRFFASTAAGSSGSECEAPACVERVVEVVR